MTIEEINLLLEEYRDAADKADRLSDKLDRNPLYTKEMVQKVDKARLELENKIADLKAKRKELQKETPKPEPIPDNKEENKETKEEPKTEPKEEPKTEPKEEPKTEPEPVKERTEILFSVGVRGKNDKLDVTLVQKLLNNRKGCKLVIDGVCGSNTNNQIIDLQRRLFQNWTVDGRIDPGGATWKWLIGTKSLPALPPAPKIEPKPTPPNPDPKKVEDPKTLPVKIVDVLGEFSNVVLPYKKEFFKLDWNTPKVPLGYGFFISGGIGAYSNADLTGKRNQNRVEITGSAKIGAYASVTIGWGFSIDGWIADTSVEASGTLRGDIYARFNIIASLSASGQEMTGSIRSTADITAKLSVSAKVVASGHILGIGGSVGYKTGSFSLGSVTFLQATTPAYAMTYNFSAKKFYFSSSGKWAVYPHPTLAANLKRAAGL
jgi:hypothetical protein